jgi:alpha-galactosidase/6-phospho-beta-glucosidase family protein
MNPKIVLVVSGIQFTEFFLQELFKCKDFRGCSLALIDRKPERLEQEMKMAETLNRAVGWDIRIEGTGDRHTALKGADFVYIFAAVNQRKTWPRKYDLAEKYGYTTLEGYTNGPASMGMSIRHVPLVLDICADMEELCPNAWMIRCNNPIPKLQAAVARHAKTKCDDRSLREEHGNRRSAARRNTRVQQAIRNAVRLGSPSPHTHPCEEGRLLYAYLANTTVPSCVASAW